MKRNYSILMLAALVTVCFAVPTLSAQETVNAEKEKEQKLQQAIELQKKALAEQKKAKDYQQQLQELQRIRMDTLRNAIRFYNGDMNIARPFGRNSGNLEGMDESFVVSPGVGYQNYYSRGGDGERTTWDFSKRVKEASFSRDYSFDVEASAKTVVMTVMGDCKSGQIKVKIGMPGGKTFSDIVIDESGNLNWRKSFTISDTENKDKAGEWKFKIDAEKATGFFKITLETY